MKKAIAVVMVATFCARLAFAAPIPGTLDALGPKLEKIRVEGDVAGLTVAMAWHGKIVYEKGFGWADRENRVPATEDTMFSIASVSKPITATALMTLVQAGKIDLD